MRICSNVVYIGQYQNYYILGSTNRHIMHGRNSNGEVFRRVISELWGRTYSEHSVEEMVAGSIYV